LLIVLVLLCAATIWILISAYNRKKTYSKKLIQTSQDLESHKNALLDVNQQLNEQNEALKQINGEKENAIRVVTHDLKAPLNRIAGLLQLLKLSLVKATPEQDRYFSLISRTVDEGSSTIQQLLDARAIWGDGYKPDVSEFKLGQLVQDIVSKYEENACAKQISLELSPPEEAICVHADLYYLSRALENLVENAIKFSFFNKKIFVSWFVQDEAVHICIEDQGPGVPKAEQELLFRKFQRLSARPTGGESSVGLGLALSKGMIERLGGALIFREAPEGGAIFQISLPFYEVSSKAVEKPSETLYETIYRTVPVSISDAAKDQRRPA
jgi:signal transduction histidine kinase